MFEETNQTTAEETIIPEELFSESDPETTEGSGAGTDGEGIPGEEGTEPKPEVQFLTAKYNGREIPIERAAAEKTAEALGVPVEDYLATLQKGMNYDHVKSEVERARQEMAALDEYARLSGTTREGLLRSMEEQKRQLLEQQELERLAERYPTENPALLSELARNEAEQKRREAEGQRQRPWLLFFRENPDLKPQDLPEEVFRAVEAGGTPKEAYLKYQYELQRQELLTLKQNRENQKKSTGTMQGDAAGEAKDPFCAGFDSVR